VVVGLLDEEVKLSADGGQVDVVPFAEVVLLSSGTQLLDPFHGVRLVGYDQMALQDARRLNSIVKQNRRDPPDTYVIVVLRHEELLDGGGMVDARLLPGPVPRYKIRELLRGVAQLFVEAALLAQLVGVAEGNRLVRGQMPPVRAHFSE
jgi:hypothetical protein